MPASIKLTQEEIQLLQKLGLGTTSMKQVSDDVKQFVLDGMFIPFNSVSSVPIFLNIGGQLLLPVFSTKEKYDEAAKWGNFELARCKMINDPKNFLESVAAYKVKVAVDPYITPEGNTRFQLLKLEG